MTRTNQTTKALASFLLISLPAALSNGCGTKASADACSAEAALASVGKVSINWRDLEQVQAEVRLSGGELSDRDALIDVLWQELGRQKLGLPGGFEIYKSRRSVVREYHYRSRAAGKANVEFRLGQVPQDVSMTACGRVLIGT